MMGHPGKVGTFAVTGADGFIGARLCSVLESRGIPVLRIVRRASGVDSSRRVVDLENVRDLSSAVSGATVLVHLAGRAHVLRETALDPDTAFRSANVDVTIRLAEAAVSASVKRFVFVSSIGVNGNETHGTPFSELDQPAPVEAYARSKLQAERALEDFCSKTALEFVIVRPPLVYGANAKGNFQRLLKLAASGLPLPIGGIRNRRSLISVDNLADFLIVCATHPAAARETFLAAEPEVYSTPELICRLARALGRPTRMFRIPMDFLRAGARALGRQSELEKLCSSLEVSSSKAQRVLGWKPASTFEQELTKIVAAHMQDSTLG